MVSSEVNHEPLACC